MKKCPECAEEIQDEARKCRYCGSSIEGSVPGGGSTRPITAAPKVKPSGMAYAIAALAVLAVVMGGAFLLANASGKAAPSWSEMQAKLVAEGVSCSGNGLEGDDVSWLGAVVDKGRCAPSNSEAIVYYSYADAADLQEGLARFENAPFHNDDGGLVVGDNWFLGVEDGGGCCLVSDVVTGSGGTYVP